MTTKPTKTSQEVSAREVSVFVDGNTSKKATASPLADKEEQFRMLAENMLDMVALHQPDGTYLYVVRL